MSKQRNELPGPFLRAKIACPVLQRELIKRQEPPFSVELTNSIVKDLSVYCLHSLLLARQIVREQAVAKMRR